VKFGVHYIGMAETIYGLVLVIFIIFLPSGIYGSLRGLLTRRRPAADPSTPGTTTARA
jgi:branched-chain amino acid transport system permease protein